MDCKHLAGLLCTLTHCCNHAFAGSRPGSAPASGSQALLATPDKQPAQRRQLAGSQHAPDAPVFTLPGFRAGSCLSADTRLGRLKQVQRPGTPNVRAEGTSSVLRSTSAAVAAFERLHKKAPIRQQLSVSAGSAAAAAYKTAAAIGHQPVTVRNAADKTVGSSRAGINSDGSVSIDLSDSDDSSWSLLNSDSSAESCSNSASDDRELQQESKVQLSYTPGAVSKRRLQITEALQHSQPNGSLSMHLTQQRQQKDAGLVTAGSMASNTCEAAGHADEASGSHSHIGGNTVLSCTSGRSHSVQLPLQSRAQHALMLQSKEVMHWLGMDDAWFEETFLPLAEKHCIVLPN